MLDYVKIENAILAALSPLKNAQHVRTIAPYSGQLERDIPDVTLRFPAVYVTFSGADFKHKNKVCEAELTYMIFCAAKNLRTQADAVSSALDLLSAVRGCLNGKYVFAELDGFLPPKVRRERVVVYVPEAGIAVCAAEYAIKARLKT